MRFFSAAMCTAVAVSLLAGCSGNSSSPSSSMPNGIGAGALARHRVATLAISKLPSAKFGQYRLHNVATSLPRGIATAQFTGSGGTSWVYPKNNASNAPPICGNASVAVNGLGSDQAGDVVIPEAFDGISVYAPPFTASSCGTLLATIPDSLGQAEDGAAINAASGTIVVGHNDGIVATCTILADSCTELTSPNMLSDFVQVAMDVNGNCYADGFNSSDAISLWVYSGTPSAPCTGTGVESTGFSETSIGGIDVDNKGNLVALSLGSPSTVTTYSGCATGACTVVQAAHALTGESVYGHVGRQNARYVTGDVTNGTIEVYSYKPATGVGAMLYDFNNGLTCSPTDPCEAAAYMPIAQR
jgi:hypothetical protein